MSSRLERPEGAGHGFVRVHQAVEHEGAGDQVEVLWRRDVGVRLAQQAGHPLGRAAVPQVKLQRRKLVRVAIRGHDPGAVELPQQGRDRAGPRAGAYRQDQRAVWNDDVASLDRGAEQRLEMADLPETGEHLVGQDLIDPRARCFAICARLLADRQLIDLPSDRR